MQNIRKGDTVIVLLGKDRDKKGKVTRVFPRDNTVVVEKVNIVKRHVKPTQAKPQGGIVEIEYPLRASKVMVVCPHCSRPTRIGHTLSADKKNVRICKKCHEVID